MVSGMTLLTFFSNKLKNKHHGNNQDKKGAASNQTDYCSRRKPVFFADINTVCNKISEFEPVIWSGISEIHEFHNIPACCGVVAPFEIKIYHISGLDSESTLFNFHDKRISQKNIFRLADILSFPGIADKFLQSHMGIRM